MSEEQSEVSLIDEDPVALGEEIFRLRRGGTTISDIARQMKLSPSAVVAIYNDHRIRLAQHEITREESRMLLRARYDAILEANFDMALMGDKDSTDNVLKVLAAQVKLEQLDQMDPKDSQVTQNILVVGNDRKAFLEALAAGRRALAEDEKIDEEEDPDE